MRFWSLKTFSALPEILLQLLVLAPLVALPAGLKYPTVLPRLGWTMCFMVALTVCFFIFSANWRARANKLDWVLTALVSGLVIRSIFSANPQTAFWSEAERGMGLVWIVYLLAVYWIMRLSIWLPGMWRRLTRVLMISVGLVAGIAVLQKIYPGFWQVIDSDRVTGTFGNSMILAGYLFLMTVWLAFLLARRFGENEKNKNFWPLAVLVLTALALIFTENRAAELGILLGLTVGGAVYIFLLPRKKFNTVLRLGATFIFVLVMLYGTTILLARVTRNTTLLTLTFGQPKTIAPTSLRTRFINWSMAGRGVSEQPLLGYGWENYRQVVDRFYDPQIAKVGGLSEARIDKPHNALLELWLAGGIGVVILYGVLWVCFLCLVWRGYKNNNFSLSAAAVLTGGVVGWQTMQLFGFDTPATLLLQILLFAYVSERGDEQTTKNIVNKKFFLHWRLIGGAFCLLVGVPIFIYGAYAPLRQGRYIYEMSVARAANDNELVDKIFRASRAVPAGAYFFETWRESADALLLDFVNGKKQIDALPADLRVRILADRAVLLTETQNFLNNHLNFLLWQQMGGRIAWYIAKSGGSDNDNGIKITALSLGEKALRRALELSPANQETRLLLAFVFLEKKQYDTAVDNFLLTLQDAVYPGALDYAAQMAGQLANEHRDEIVVRLFEGYVARQPNAPAYARLAAAYAAQHENDKARVAVEKAVLLDQSFQVEAIKFLQTLRP